MRYVVLLFGAFACLGIASETFCQNLDLAKGGRGADKKVAVYALAPPYPYEARHQELVGSGIALLEVDKRTGYVKSARMQPSTGHKILDDAALGAFKQWRFDAQLMQRQWRSRFGDRTPPAAWKVNIPIAYTMAGAAY